eukprot:TRINITY_DN33476_c0_g1_i1.p1 TRINITY_DN33476_c0_g1~~TRINITY_DN33476_c0_g1_i1.p1  ORF type:complete len:513 (+),score=79.01 TRINITY_DN33476_c0_g1_i1:65-1603(+)
MAGLRIQWTPWVTLTAGVFAMLLSGPVFTFGAIGSHLQGVLNLTELEKQMVGVAGDVGLWTKIFPGLVFDRLGARATMIVGSALSLVGFVSMHLVMSNQASPALVALAWFLVGEGSGFTYTSAIFASTKNFQAKHRSMITSVLACAFGLSSSILVSMLKGCMGGELQEGKCAHGFLNGDLFGYMKFLAVIVPAVTFLAGLASIVREGEANVGGLRFRLSFVTAILIALTVFIFAQNLLIQLGNFQSMTIWGGYVILALTLMLLLLPVGGAHALTIARSPEVNTYETGSKVEPASDCKSVFKDWRFWAVVIVFGITVGVDLMTLNVMSNLAIAQGLPDGSGATLVVVQMTADTVARLSSGFLVAGDLARPTLMFSVAPFLTIVGQLLLTTASGKSALVYLASIMLGMSDGLMWSLGPLLTGQLFGLKNVGRNFGVVVASAAVFQCALSLGLEPLVYDSHKQSGEVHCIGNSCFTWTHGTSAVLAMLAFFLAAHLMFRAERHAEEPKTSADEVC